MLINRDIYQQLINNVSKERLSQSLAEMVKIPSVNPFDREASENFRELEFSRYLLEKFESLGLETNSHEVTPNRPNIWGVLKGKGEAPSLAWMAHTDTVGIENYENPFHPYVENDCLHGRGSCDMKAALAAYLEALLLIQEAQVELPGDLYIIGIMDEEYQMVGSKNYPDHGPQADFGIVGEPTDLTICPAHRGQLVFKITSFGKAAHSSRKELGQNAIRSMMNVIQMIEDYDQELQNQAAHPLCGYTGCSPNIIHGGTVASIVPDLCELEVDIRQLPGVETETIKAELSERLAKLQREDPGSKFEISDPIWNSAPLEVESDSMIVQALSESHEMLFGQPPELQAFPAATDAPNLGFPIIVCGPGSLEQAHSTNEFVPLEQVVNATKLYLGCLFQLSKRKKPSY